jgi:hypothetical protein
MSPHCSVYEAYRDFRGSPEFRNYPLRVRDAFQRVATWLPAREAAFSIVEINAPFARMLRDRACRERGWRFANFTLALLQALIARAVDSGMLTKNPVRQIQKILPPRRQSNERRPIKPIRYRQLVANTLSKAENSSA